jgi:hypothetical protein
VPDDADEPEPDEPSESEVEAMLAEVRLQEAPPVL